MGVKKILIGISSIVLVGTLLFFAIWGIINFGKVKDAMSGTSIYTKTDIDNAYNDGYKSALDDKVHYEELLSTYRDTISQYEKKILEYKDALTNANASIVAKDALVKEYESQISELEKLVDYYKALLSAYEDTTKVVATFVYNGEIYDVQVYSIDSYVGVDAPADTDYIQFNGWKVNDELVDLSAYQIIEDTTFEADLTYYQYVNLIAQDETIATKKVEKGSTIDLTAIEVPTVKYASHIGWTIEEIDSLSTKNDIVDSNVTIEEDMTYYAYYAVDVDGTFIDESNTYALTIENNEITSCQLGDKTISRTSIKEVAYSGSTNWYSVILTDANSIEYEMKLYNYAQSFIVELSTGQGLVEDLIILKDTSYVVNSATSVGNFKYYDVGTLTFSGGILAVKSSVSSIGKSNNATYVTDNVYCYSQTNGWHYSVHYIAYIDCWLGCRAYGAGVDATAVADQYSQLHIFSRV